MVGATYAAAVASDFTSVKNTLTDIDATQQGFRHTRVIFMGDDSSQNPVFAYAYRDNSDFYIKIVAFRVNKSTGALTIGTPGTVIQVAGDPDNNFYSVPGLSGENSDAGTRATSYSNYGYVGFYHGGSTNASRMFAFSVNVSTLAVTVGTGVSHFSSIDSGVCSMTYVGNSRVVFGMRGGGGYRYYNMFSRSGTTLTSVATATQSGNAGTSGNFLGEAAVVNSGTNYRMATVSSTYGLDTIQWATTTYYIDQEPIANIFSNKDFSGTTGWVLPLNGTDKFVMSMYNAADTAVYAQAVSVSWGSTTPTNTVGTRLTLTGTDNSPLAFAPGQANNEFFYIYESGSTIRYRKITASGTTLTQGSEVDTTLSSTNLIGSSRYEIAKSGSGDYLVGFVDDSASAIWQVVAIKLSNPDAFTAPTSAFTSDADTVVLYHLDNALTDSGPNTFTLNTSGGYSSSTKQFGTHSGDLSDSGSDYFAHTTDRYFAPYNGTSRTDLTWECWVYYTSFSGASFNHASQNNPHPTLLCAGDQAGNRQSMKFGFSGSEGPYASGLLCFAAGDSGNGNIDTYTERGTTSFSLNTWYHIALTYNASTGNVKGYVDGVKQFTKSAPNLGFNLGTHFTIGAMQSNNSACFVDEVRVSRTIRYGS
jgi:hypothetical protein